MRLAAVAAALVGCSLVAPQSVDAQLARPKIDTVGGRVVRVMNPGPTRWADTNGWKLVLERTIQPAEGDPGELQRPGTVLRTSSGQFVIQDWGGPRIMLLDANGRFVRNLGRSGAGPGEYRKPAITLHHDTLVIQDGGLARVTLMTLDGKVVRSFSANSNSGATGSGVDEKGRLPVGVFDGKSRYWAFYTLDGKLLDSLKLPDAAPRKEWRVGTASSWSAVGVPFTANNVHLLLKEGVVAYGANTSYQLFLTRKGRDTLRMFGRSDLPGVPIPARVRDSIFELSTQNSAMRAVAKLSDMPERYPLWTSLNEDGSGNVWILAGGEESRPYRFDVFNRDGRFLGAVALPFKSWRFRFLGDRVAFIDTDDNDLPRIRIYRIDQRGK